MTIWLELMVKLRTLLSVFTFILKAKARDYGKGRYISDAASGVRPITMHCQLANQSRLCLSEGGTTDSSGRRETGPPTEPGFSQGFFSILSPMEFSFLATVASGLLSWGHFISNTIIDLIAQILFKLN